MEKRSSVSTFGPGREVAVPAQALEAAGIEDGRHVVFEPGDGGLWVRALTAQEEVDAGIVEHFGSGEDLLAALRRDLKPEQ